jgi:hypothetical protein
MGMKQPSMRVAPDGMVNENFHYGLNATRQAFWSVPSDPGDRWPDSTR